LSLGRTHTYMRYMHDMMVLMEMERIVFGVAVAGE